MQVGIVSLSSCSGCQMALLDQKEVFTLLGEIKFATTLFDEREIPDMDYCLVEGAVRNSGDVKKLQEVRKKAKILISLGSCAVFGGLQALGNLFPAQKIIETVVEHSEENPFSEAPALTSRVSPLDEFVAVDYFIPGCPPSTSVLENAISLLFLGQEQQEDKNHRLPVCADCERKIEHQKLNHFEGITIANPNTCLLSQGYMCLGSVTRGGCGAQCPDHNIPCSGCRGPTDRVLVKPTHTILRDFVKRVAHFTGRLESDIEKEIKAIPWRFYPFTFASQSLRNKPHSKILELQAPLTEEE
ncbi:MAG: F420-nonreducing hydrogenase [Candidatus Hermodarchaeota archaeon]